MVLTIVSVLIGTAISALLFIFKNKNHEFGDNELLWLGTNFGFSLLIVLGIGIYLTRRKKDDDMK